MTRYMSPADFAAKVDWYEPVRAQIGIVEDLLEAVEKADS